MLTTMTLVITYFSTILVKYTIITLLAICLYENLPFYKFSPSENKGCEVVPLHALNIWNKFYLQTNMKLTLTVKCSEMFWCGKWNSGRL